MLQDISLSAGLTQRHALNSDLQGRFYILQSRCISTWLLSGFTCATLSMLIIECHAHN